jgi:hypothetical protein
MSLDARQRCVFEAKLAEQAERHDGASTSDAIDGAIDGATDERRIDRVEARAGARGASRTTRANGAGAMTRRDEATDGSTRRGARRGRRTSEGDAGAVRARGRRRAHDG